MTYALTMPGACARCAVAAALLLGACLAASGSASFVENFTPSEDPNKQAITPGLWNQIGKLSTEDGRGTDAANKAAMMLSEDHPTAETVLLDWDGTKDTLDFWYYLTGACDSGYLKVNMSCNGKDWFEVWNFKKKDMQAKAYNIARVKLPLNATCPAFAVRWDFEAGSCYWTQYLYIDEITFPARGVAGAQQQSTAAQSSTTPGTQVSFNGDAGQNAGQDGSKQPETTSNKGSSPGASVVTTGGDANVVVKTSKGSRVHPGKGWWLLPVLYMCLL